MNVLLLEDRGDASYFLNEHLEQKGHKVFPAQNVSRAKTFWKTKDIDCIIADLNMAPLGLSASEVEQTENGLFTGWVWLKNYVFPGNEAMKRRTIILTAYIRDFRARLKQEGVKPEDIGIQIVAKESNSGFGKEQTESVLVYVEEIAKQLESYDEG